MSTTVEFPIRNIPYQNTDSVLLHDYGDVFYDGYIDELGNPTKRPGYTEFTDLLLSNKVQGLYWWDAKSIVIAVCEGRTFKVEEAGTITDLTSDLLETTGRPTFADNGEYLVIANGGRMLYTDGSASTTYIADADAPTTVTHVAYIDGYIVCFKTGTDFIYFADFESGAPTTWNAADFFSAEVKTDAIKSLYVSNRIIYIFGDETIEFFVNDGVSPFQRVGGSSIQRGSMSAYSQVLVGDSFFFFDENRKFTRLDGYTPTIINTSFDKVFNNLSTVNDCLLDFINFEGRRWVICSFPTEGRSFLYDIDSNYWSEWTYWDMSTSTRKQFALNCHCYAKGFNKQIIGSRFVSKLYELSSSNYSDDNVNIHFLKRTGFIDYDYPDRLKRSYQISIRMRSGVGIGTSNATKAYARLRFRDENNDRWSNYRLIDIGSNGQREFLKKIHSNGSFYVRQYEVSMTDNVPFSIGKSTERLDVNEF